MSKKPTQIPAAPVLAALAAGVTAAAVAVSADPLNPPAHAADADAAAQVGVADAAADQAANQAAIAQAGADRAAGELAPMTLAEAAALVRRRKVVEAPGAQPRVFDSAISPSEVLAFHDHGTHVVVVTTDGQKFSTADAA